MTAPEIIRRTFPIALTRSGPDQRTVGGCCVPFNRPTLVSDDGGETTYREMFRRGAFARQLAADHRITLGYNHGETLPDQVGRATQLVEEEHGLFGMFRVLNTIIGDQALAMIDEGLLPGLSIGGRALKSTRSPDGVVVRTWFHLEHVALCEEPAYAEALVTVRRTRAILELPEPPPAEQLARLAAVGIRIDRPTPLP